MIAIRLYAAIAIIGGCALTAHAQAPLQFGLALCKNIKNDTDRLKCFDSLAGPQIEDKGEPPAQPDWSVDETRAPLDDSSQVTALLKATDGDAALGLRCKEHKTEVTVLPTKFTYLGSGGQLTVTIRINDGQPVVARWSPSTTGQAAFAPNAVQFIRALPDQGTLFVRVVGYGGTPHDAKFSLGAVSDVRNKIATACNWDARAQSPATPAAAPRPVPAPKVPPLTPTPK